MRFSVTSIIFQVSKLHVSALSFFHVKTHIMQMACNVALCKHHLFLLCLMHQLHVLWKIHVWWPQTRHQRSDIWFQKTYVVSLCTKTDRRREKGGLWDKVSWHAWCMQTRIQCELHTLQNTCSSRTPRFACWRSHTSFFGFYVKLLSLPFLSSCFPCLLWICNQTPETHKH